jgi:hypothetical protein
MFLGPRSWILVLDVLVPKQSLQSSVAARPTTISPPIICLRVIVKYSEGVSRVFRKNVYTGG